MEINCWNHLLHPLHFTFAGKKYSLNNQKLLIIRSIVLGVFTFAIGGIVFFYKISADKKLKMKRRLEEPTKSKNVFRKIIPISRKAAFLQEFDRSMDFKTINAKSSIEMIQQAFPDYTLVKGNDDQDRYPDNLPWAHSQVSLPQVNFLENDYINASWIAGKKMIATQAPTENTVLSFWWMIFTHKVKNIVMLTSELAKGGFCYWPSEQSANFAQFSLKLLKTYCVRLPGRLIIRKLQLGFNGKKRVIFHYQMPDWKDHNVIPAKDLCTAIRIIRKSEEKRPTVVHCDAGLGRTGTYIAASHLLDDPTCDDAKTIVSMRMDRPNLVRNEEQRQLVVETLHYQSIALPKEKRSIADVCIDVTTSLRNLIYSDDFDSKEGPFIQLSTFYPNKRFIKKKLPTTLSLPIQLFKDLKEGDTLSVKKPKKFRLILNQNGNIFSSNNYPFESYLQQIHDRQISLSTTPFASFRITENTHLFGLAPCAGRCSLEMMTESPVPTAPECIEWQVVLSDDNFLIIEVELPNTEMKEIYLLLNESQLMVYAKLGMRNSLSIGTMSPTFTKSLGDEELCVPDSPRLGELSKADSMSGEEIAISLEVDEYFAAFPWKEHADLSYPVMADRLKSAMVAFENEKLTIKFEKSARENLVHEEIEINE